MEENKTRHQRRTKKRIRRDRNRIPREVISNQGRKSRKCSNGSLHGKKQEKSHRYENEGFRKPVGQKGRNELWKSRESHDKIPRKGEGKQKGGISKGKKHRLKILGRPVTGPFKRSLKCSWSGKNSRKKGPLKGKGEEFQENGNREKEWGGAKEILPFPTSIRSTAKKRSKP